MKTIELGRFMPELSALYSFYRYSETAFADQNTRRRLEAQEFETMWATAEPFLKDSPVPGNELPGKFQEIIRTKVREEIEGGLATLRRQLLETAHSIFEKFLCHVVRVYFHVFPDILRNIDKTIPFRTVVELRNDTAIFDHIVETEIEHFSRRSLGEKKDYLAKHLKLTHQDEIWVYEGQEMWKEIDRIRQAIVHREETPEVTHEYLLHAITYLQRAMFAMSIRAQVDQGVPLSWGVMGDYIRKKPGPTLKGD